MNPPRGPLHRSPHFHTTKIREIEESLGRLFIKPSIEIIGRAGKFQATLRNRQLQQIGISYSKYAAARITLPETNNYSQVFPIGGGGEFLVANRSVLMSLENGLAPSPGMVIGSNFRTPYEQLTMRIDPNALTRKLAAIRDAPLGPALQMKPVQDFTRPAARNLRDLFLFFVAELDAADEPLPSLALVEWEQALMVAYLCGNRHNYSHLLERGPPSIAPWQVRRVEEYIEANWNQPIRIEDIAAVAGTSARSIYRAFRHSRGYSPMTFAKQLRLRHARRLLQSSDEARTVKDVAFACGIGHVGRFSKDYYRAFGEWPSNTVKRA